MAFSVILTSGSLILLFPLTSHGEVLCIKKVREFKANARDKFITDHPDLHTAQACLENTSPYKFLFPNSSLIWSAVFILRLVRQEVLG